MHKDWLSIVDVRFPSFFVAQTRATVIKQFTKIIMKDESKERDYCMLYGSCLAHTAKKYWITPFTNKRIAPSKQVATLQRKIVLGDLPKLFQMISSGSGALLIATYWSLTINQLIFIPHEQNKLFIYDETLLFSKKNYLEAYCQNITRATLAICSVTLIYIFLKYLC